MKLPVIQALAVLFVFRIAAPTHSAFPVGVAGRQFAPFSPYDWRGAETHSLVTTVWYPAAAGSAERPQWIGPPRARLFRAGRAAPEARLAAAPAKFPLIVLSHGTGGSALMMAWLGTALASRGYIAAAVNHPGNNALEPYTVEGFSKWWERARDLSVVIDRMLADADFGSRIDARRIGAAGFSLGGYTMIEIAGGITDLSLYRQFCNSPRADAICKAPPEFPGLVERFNAMDQAAFTGHSDSRRDPRVRAVFAIAPALGPAFRPDSLERISIPVAIVAGGADEIVPVASNAKYFAAHIPRARLALLEGRAGHYVFLAACTDQGRKAVPVLCGDSAGVDREAVHRKAAGMAVEFFDRHLR